MTQLLADLIEAGTPAHLVAEVAMLLAKAEVADQRRASDRARQQAKRDRDSNDSHVTSRDVTDCHDNPPPPSPPSFPPTPPITPPTPTPPYKQPRARKGQSDELRPDGLTDQAWSDFLAVRKAKRLPLTKTAMDAIQREAEDVGWTLPQAITHAAKSSWGGFKASWIRKEQAENERKSSNSDKRDGAAMAIDRRLAELAGTPERRTACDGYGTGQSAIAAIADMR